MTTIAFVTSAELAELTADDRLAIPHLEARGARVVPAVWTDERVRWDTFDLVVLRSPWDWHVDPARFAAFVESLERRVRVENRRTAAWLDKRYLARLGQAGVRVVPTEVVASRDDLAAKVAKYNEPLVLKPATAAGASRTERFDARGAAPMATLDAILARRVANGDFDAALLQPFVPEVESDGEWSLLFFDGTFSHAIKKRPKRGDFRVQEEFGGSVEMLQAPPEIVRAAAHALEVAGGRFLYARVDGIVVPRFGGFCVTELEVVEPEVFLRAHPEAPARFAEAMLQRVTIPAV
ncbi:MAG TPA: hypothetical protein VGH28_03215 [Polyangiaceae bacterium]|jgi:glutathione synthase/RimK-type ligase-like ATP-grasp enzyme